jgi:hypothetical protein
MGRTLPGMMLRAWFYFYYFGFTCRWRVESGACP